MDSDEELTKGQKLLALWLSSDTIADEYKIQLRIKSAQVADLTPAIVNQFIKEVVYQQFPELARVKLERRRVSQGGNLVILSYTAWLLNSWKVTEHENGVLRYMRRYIVREEAAKDFEGR